MPAYKRREWLDQHRAKAWHWAAFLAERERYSATEHMRLVRWTWGTFAEAFWSRYERDHFLRELSRNLGAPYFAFTAPLVALLLLAAITAGFERTRTLLLPTPIPAPDKFVSVAYAGTWWSPLRAGVPPLWIPAWETQAKQIDGVAEYALQSSFFDGNGFRDLVGVARVSSNFFDLSRAKPVIGVLPAEKDFESCRDCVVLSYNFWADSMHKRRDILGKQVTLGIDTVRIVGVAPKRFWLPESGAVVWRPVRKPVSSSRWVVGTIVRVKDDVAVDSAQRELRTIIQETFGWPGGELEVTSLEAQARGTLLIYWVIALIFVPVALLIGLTRFTPANLDRHQLLRWSGYLLLKPIIPLTFCALMMIELTPPIAHAMGYVFESAVWSLAAWLFLALSVAVVMWCVNDQRYRCPVCLSRLHMPVLVGDPSRLLFDRGATEFVCPRGHGLLHISDMQCSWIDAEAWTQLDESWHELFTEEK